MHIVQEICQNAAKLLRTKGWCQKVSVNPMGALCLAQAMGQAHDHTFIGRGNKVKDLAFDHLTRVLNEDLDKKKECGGFVFWNDMTGRTKEEVLSLLDRAATTPVKEVD